MRLFYLFGLVSLVRSFITAHLPPKSVILMISDGFGPASETMARDYMSTMLDSKILPLDAFLKGSSRTRSASSPITDSAAGATAFSCGIKTYNAAIAVDTDKKPCGTILEAAKAQGYHTALVATSRITHATPASFAAHVPHRDMENLIALHEIGNTTLGRSVDLMMGGGLCHFLPKSAMNSCRADELNVIEMAEEIGWNVHTNVTNLSHFKASNIKLPSVFLFDNDHMSYEIDRNPQQQPSLLEMTQKALEVLENATAHSTRGYFIMIEGSRIDMAAHANDPGTHLHEILMYQKVADYVTKFVESRENIVMISVSDHETGGLSVGYQSSSAYPEYVWFPKRLSTIKKSAYMIGKFMHDEKKWNDREFIVKTLFADWLGIYDPSEDEIDFCMNPAHTIADFEYTLGHFVSKRAGLGWSTHGHSAVDVNLYAHGVDAHKLAGSHENTDIGAFIVDFLDLDLQSITDKLRRPGSGFEIDESMVNLSQLEENDPQLHYHHHGHHHQKHHPINLPQGLLYKPHQKIQQVFLI